MNKINKFLILPIISILLFGNITFAATQSIPSDSKICTKFTQTLKYRDGYNSKKREFVKELQKILIEYGYLKGTADGFFGKKTESALKVYQRKNDLVDTGKLDSNSMLSLRSQFCNVGVAVCDYAAPPEGCNYIPGPQYDSASQCGMVLSCTNQDAPNCKVWNDGCNVCSRNEVGGQQMCTMRACYQFQQGTAYCQEYFK